MFTLFLLNLAISLSFAAVPTPTITKYLSSKAGKNFDVYSEGYRTIKYIAIHYTQNANMGAEAHCRYFNTTVTSSSAHYFIGYEGEIYQSVADKDNAWHIGGAKYIHPEARNLNAIGVELCVRKSTSGGTSTDRDWYFLDDTVEGAVHLTKYLMQSYGVDTDHVIRHYDVTGKICPNPYVYNLGLHTWSEFKELIAAPMFYKVKITSAKATIKSGPSAEYNDVLQYDKDTQLGIVDESNGYGRLANGRGWISLSNTAAI